MIRAHMLRIFATSRKANQELRKIRTILLGIRAPTLMLRPTTIDDPDEENMPEEAKFLACIGVANITATDWWGPALVTVLRWQHKVGAQSGSTKWEHIAGLPEYLLNVSLRQLFSKHLWISWCSTSHL